MSRRGDFEKGAARLCGFSFWGIKQQNLPKGYDKFFTTEAV
jgi:hypothetical protein